MADFFQLNLMAVMYVCIEKSFDTAFSMAYMCYGLQKLPWLRGYIYEMIYIYIQFSYMMFARFILSEMDIKGLEYTLYNIQQFNKILISSWSRRFIVSYNSLQSLDCSLRLQFLSNSISQAHLLGQLHGKQQQRILELAFVLTFIASQLYKYCSMHRINLQERNYYGWTRYPTFINLVSGRI